MPSAADLAGHRVVVTAGGTREPIDPVRYLGNRSSGKMGNALADAAAQAGADVVLVTAAAPPQIDGVAVVGVETAAQMNDAVHAALQPGAVLIMAAAVADYRPELVAPRKLKKSADGFALALVPTVDILATLARDERRASLYVVGFAAETDDVVANGMAKVHGKNLDLCIVNDVSQPGIGMGADDNAVTIVDADGIVDEIARAPKPVVARRIIDVIGLRLHAR